MRWQWWARELRVDGLLHLGRRIARSAALPPHGFFGVFGVVRIVFSVAGAFVLVVDAC